MSLLLDPIENELPTLFPVSDYQATVLLASMDRSYGLNCVASTKMCMLMSFFTGQRPSM